MLGVEVEEVVDCLIGQGAEPTATRPMIALLRFERTFIFPWMNPKKKTIFLQKNQR